MEERVTQFRKDKKGGHSTSFVFSLSAKGGGGHSILQLLLAIWGLGLGGRSVFRYGNGGDRVGGYIVYWNAYFHFTEPRPPTIFG